MEGKPTSPTPHVQRKPEANRPNSALDCGVKAENLVNSIEVRQRRALCELLPRWVRTGKTIRELAPEAQLFLSVPCKFNDSPLQSFAMC